MTEKQFLSQLMRYHTGRENAVRGPELATLTGITVRKVRSHINALRTGGHPVCSGDDGYFYAATDEELAATIRQLGSRMKEIAKAQRGLEKCRRRLAAAQQTSLPV